MQQSTPNQKQANLYEPFYDPSKSYEDNYRNGPFGEFAAKTGSSQRESKPENSFLGKVVHTPFGIPAGPLLNANFVKAAFSFGFDVCVYKTVRSRTYPCHPKPNVLAVHVEGDLTLKQASGELEADEQYNQPLSITNSFGVPSMDPGIWQEDMASAVQAAGNGQICIGSFQGTRDPNNASIEAFVKDHVSTARLVKETKAPIIEINLSCPNEGTSDLLCFDTERVKQIAHAVKEEIGDTPLILKLAYFESQSHLENMVKKLSPIVQAFSVINTIPATIVDQDGNQALPGEGRSRSGVCGSAIKWAGLEMVERLAALREKTNGGFEIVGVGGVMTKADYQEYRTAGANCVMSATGAMWNPYLAQEIKQ
jgi:dihydroorotate dehydrogenase (NAD+) catalytic subunit